jgi:hydrogenase maturation protease
VDVVDAGTPGMDLAGLIADADAVIVVDTVTGDEAVGTVKTYDRQRLLSRPLQPRTNPHAPGLSETLLSLDILGLGPRDVLLVGVVPGAVEVGHALSPELEAAIPVVLGIVTDELDRLGVPLTPREDPGPPDLWWKRSPALSGRP